MLSRSLLILLLFLSVDTAAQTFAAKIVDEKTLQPVPYATIAYGEGLGVISNEEGRFSFSEALRQDSVFISSMGYERKGISRESLGDTIVYLKPKAIKLDGVYLFDNPLTVEEIIEKTRENFAENYKVVPMVQRLFLRESSSHKLATFDIEVKKSTIAELDEQLIDSVVNIVPKSSAYYTETLGDFYRSPGKYKLNVIKAAQLYDKTNDGSMEMLGEKLETIFKKNVKPDSYLKFKSGLFSQKIEIDSVLEANEEAAEVEEEMKSKSNSHFISGRKRVIDDILSELFIEEDAKLNVFNKSGRYRFELLGFSDIGEAGVYVISFEPKRKADFKGKLFINIEDFAVMRIDFQNVKRLRNFNLLGLTYRENAFRGTFAFRKISDGPYAVRFMELLIGRQMGVDRPLKVIEKNKNVPGRRKQNELSMDIKIVDNNFDKIELVVFETRKIDSSQFVAVKEDSTVEATYMPRYNPEFWQGYTIMEPNTAIKEFSVSGD